MDIIPDPMLVLLQAIPFLVTIVALQQIIFRPMLDYLDERETTIAGALREADELRGLVAERMSRYEEKVEAARLEAAELRARRRGEAMAAHEARLKHARAAAEKDIAEALATVAGERDAARASLDATARAMATDIAGRVLGRQVA